MKKQNWLLRKARLWLDSLLYFLYPPTCLNCQKQFVPLPGNIYFCPACWQQLQPANQPRCPRCLEENNFSGEGEQLHCWTCQRRQFSFDKLYSCLEFHGMTRTAIFHFKFRAQRKLAYPLSQVILAGPPADFNPQNYDYLLPVPLPWSRRLRRGFNQTSEIAKYLAPQWQIQLLSKELLRAKHTPPLSQGSDLTRQKQIKDCFKLAGKTPLAGKRLLLFDDIATSRSTLDECARVLKKGGAATVDAFTLAVSSR